MRAFNVLTNVSSLLNRERGEGAVLWSLGLIVMAGVIAIVVGPEVSGEWRDFVGKPVP